MGWVGPPFVSSAPGSPAPIDAKATDAEPDHGLGYTIGGDDDPWVHHRKAALTELDRHERLLTTRLVRMFREQERDTVERLRSAALRKGTRYWHGPGAGTKQLDADAVFNLSKWRERLTDEGRTWLEDIVEPVATDVAMQLGGAAFNIADPQAQAFLAAATNRLVLVNDTTWQLVRDELLAGMGEGEGFTDLADRVGTFVDPLSTDLPAGMDELEARVRGVFDQARRMRARRIARTEVTMAANGGAQVAARQSGVVSGKRWLATSDDRTRDSHAFMDAAKVVGLDEAFIVGGERLQHPGDPAGSARNVVNCRCTMLFVRNAAPSDRLEPQAPATSTEGVVPEAPEPEDDVPATPGRAPEPDGPIRPRTGVGVKSAREALDDVIHTSALGRRASDGAILPMSSRDKLLGKGSKVTKAVNRGTDAIGKVHAVPESMQRLPMTSKASKGANGTLYSTLGDEPRALYLAVSSQGSHPTLTFVHEFGHYLDVDDIAGGGFWTTSGSAEQLGDVAEAMGKLQQALEDSQAIQSLRKLPDLGEIQVELPSGTTTTVRVSRSHVDYMLNPKEQLARAYAQFIAEESGDPVLLAELLDEVEGPDTRPGSFGAVSVSNKVYYGQWKTDDFQPIRQAFRALFRAAGLAD